MEGNDAPRVLGVDVGGTFTDLVTWDGTTIHVGKVATTSDQSEGVAAGALELTGGHADTFLHGTTVATNALLERKGARTALVTSAGFTDVIEIGRQDRPSLYDSFADRPEPLVPPERRHAIAPDAPLPDDLGDPEAVAISLLYGYERPEEEARAEREVLKRHPGTVVARSSDVVAEFREFERTSTTVLNAYLMPVVGRYLAALVERSGAAGLPEGIAVMRSSGGLIPAQEAASLPAAVLLSGPAGGVVAAAGLGVMLGHRRIVTFDMGGTSTDVCRIEDGRPQVAYGREIDGYACLMPATAIHTVGAGGGSVAWVDRGGSLRVGPQSSGAVPGPACYGRGGIEAAVTDANVALGRIDPSGRLAGGLRLDPELAAAALQRVGERLDLSNDETAAGIVTVVEEVMAGALRRVSVEEGADPRGAQLMAFGGAGGLHATSLARRLDMAGVIVPAHAGVFSALGLLLSPPRVDVSQTVMLDASRHTELGAACRAVADRAEQRLLATAGVAGEAALEVDVRYVGQSHELTVPYRTDVGWTVLASRFHAEHERRNGFARRYDPIEAVTVRAVAVGEPALKLDQVAPPSPEGALERGRRMVRLRDGETEARVVWRPALAPGDEVAGPAVIEEPEATTFLAPGDRATVHGSGALEVEW